MYGPYAVFLDGSIMSLITVFEKSRSQSRIMHFSSVLMEQLSRHCIVFYDITLSKGPSQWFCKMSLSLYISDHFPHDGTPVKCFGQDEYISACILLSVSYPEHRMSPCLIGNVKFVYLVYQGSLF